MTGAAESAGEVKIAVGGIPIRLHLQSPEYLGKLKEHYAAFIQPPDGEAVCDLDIRLLPGRVTEEEDLRLRHSPEGWVLERSDLRAELSPDMRRGAVTQSEYLVSIDTVLRAVYTLLLAREGGFLLHAASAVRKGRAFVFSGISGSGKTTMTRLAPCDAAILTDEISYIRKQGDAYRAFGTPFAGELARAGENVDAPLAAVYLLAHGAGNRIEPLGAAQACSGLLRNILFFAEDAPMAEQVFHAACDLAGRVPVFRLEFTPDARVWEMIE